MSGPGAADVPTRAATTWIVVGSAVNGVAAFGFQVLGTRALGPEAYAPIGVLWTLQYLWIAVAVTAIEAYLTRTVTLGGRDAVGLRRFLRLLRTWLVMVAIAVAIGAWWLREPLFEGLGDLAVVLGLVVLGYGWYGVVRGQAAGLERFRTYGLATMGESVVRLLAAAAVLAIVVSTRSLAWVFPVGPLLVAGWFWARDRPARWQQRRARTRRAGHDEGPTGIARRFLSATSTANACVQVLLAGGPVVLIPLGAEPATISVFFTTSTAARVPMTFALNGGLSRLLPPLVQLAQDDDVAGLRRATVRLLAAIGATAAVGAGTAAWLGPELIAAVFSEGFRPDRMLVTLIALGTVLAVGGLLLDQLFIALGREARLPVIWLGAVIVAAALVVVLPGDPAPRVATAFTVATALAVAVLGGTLLRPGGLDRRRPLPSHP